MSSRSKLPGDVHQVQLHNVHAISILAAWAKEQQTGVPKPSGFGKGQEGGVTASLQRFLLKTS
jgi:hypothetical protein